VFDLRHMSSKKLLQVSYCGIIQVDVVLHLAVCVTLTEIGCKSNSRKVFKLLCLC